MKYIKLFFLLLLVKNLSAQDSTVRYWIYSEATGSANIETDNPSYASTREVYYLKDGVWKMESRFIDNGNLYMTGSYADGKGSVREGDFVTYYRGGAISSIISYKNGKEDGLYQKWYEKKQRKDSFLMKDGFVIGKGFSWNDDGSIHVIYDLDNTGSGTVKTIDNKIIRASDGSLHKGKKDGKWVYYAPEGYKEWELVYQMDSVISYRCFDNSGKDQKDCIFQKEAEVIGGINAWISYLQKGIAKYDYPSKKISKSKTALSGQVQVKFLVNKDGSISEVNVVKSLNAEADFIARNVILSAPKWSPGIYMNKPVRSFHTQPITFEVRDK